MLIRRAELLCLLLNLLWTPSPGLAHNGCSGFGHLENGRMFFRYGGLYVTFTCNPGFRIYGYRTSSCVSGQWARKPPLCVASGCPTPGRLLHGSIAMSQDRSLAFFSCDAGFSLVGSALLYCKGNSWNGTKPVCKVSDIMSVLHLKEESLDDPVLALRLEASSRLKDLLHSHLNSIAITAPKDTFLKSALLGVSHAKSDFIGKKESIRKPPLKRPSFEFSEADILKEPINLESSIDPIRNTGADVLKEPISLENSKDPIRNTGADVPKEPISLENSKDPIRNTGADVLKEPFSLENSTDPIRNKDFLKLTAAFTDSTTISLTSTFNESLLRTATMPTNFITPVTDRPVEGSTTKIMGQTLTKTPYRGNERNHQSTFATDKPFQSIPVVSTFQTSPLYAEMNSHWTSTTSAPNINTPGTNVLPTDHFKSVMFTTKSPFEGTTGFVFQELTQTIIKSNEPGKVWSNGKLQSQFHEISKFDHTSESPGKPTSSVGYMESEHNSVSSTSFLDSSAYNTVPSLCGGFCDQKPELLETSPPPRPSKHTSTSMELLTMSTQQVSGLPLKTPDVHLIRNHTYNVQNNSSTLPTRSSFLHQILRNGTLLKIIDNQVNKRSNQSNLKQTLDPPTRQHLEITSSTIARLPTRKHRPVCSYPPLPSHGTFYFRAMKNPGPLQYKHYIQYACYPGYTLTNGDVYSYCQHNGQWSGVTPLCLELTPCSINSGGCSQICQVNDQHRAQCLCKPGFLLLEDQRTCRDLDECVEELHSCQQVCENTLGSYRCSCGPGFQLSSDGTSCSDVDECLHTVGLSVCVFGCINTPGSFQCLCPDGYTLDSTNRHCVDIDECVENVGPGTCTGACQNTLGSFRCTCEPGFQLAGDGRECVPECPPGFRKLHNSPGNSSDERCVDINECEESQVFREKRMHRCEWRCVNLPGTHRCICPRGYRLQFNGHQCEDVNECELKNGICSHICINHRGGYRCACPETHRISPYNPKNCQPIYTQTDSSH